MGDKFIIYELQDLMLQNDMPTMESFKYRTFEGIYVPKEILCNIFTFVEQMQKHPKKHLLAYAMEKVFEDLICNAKQVNTTEKYIVEHLEEINERSDLPYDNLFLALAGEEESTTTKIPKGIFELGSIIVYGMENEILSKYTHWEDVVILDNYDEYEDKKTSPIIRKNDTCKGSKGLRMFLPLLEKGIIINS